MKFKKIVVREINVNSLTLGTRCNSCNVDLSTKPPQKKTGKKEPHTYHEVTGYYEIVVNNKKDTTKRICSMCSSASSELSPEEQASREEIAKILFHMLVEDN